MAQAHPPTSIKNRVGPVEAPIFASTLRLSRCLDPTLPCETCASLNLHTEDRTPPSSPDDAALQLAGKAYGVTFSFWKKFFNFLADGPTLTTIANPSYLSDK